MVGSSSRLYFWVSIWSRRCSTSSVVTVIGDGMADFVEVGLGYRFSNLFFKGCEYVLFEEEAIVPLDVLLT